jgi:hypothetical protein
MKIQNTFTNVTIAALFGGSALAVDPCTDVPELAKHVASITVTSSSWTSSNELIVTDSNTGASLPNHYAFCRVKGHIEYSGNNTLSFELWLPEQESFNERYLVAGRFKRHIGSKKTSLTLNE